MDELTLLMFELLVNTAVGPYLTLIALVALVTTHLVPHLPPSVTEKVPNWVMLILNSLAGQYKHSENMTTDMKGNRR